MPGILTISLDFELHWGGFEKWVLEDRGATTQQAATGQATASHKKFGPAKTYNGYFLNTRLVIPEMLNLFAHYQVHVTWATVGLLMHSNKSELLSHLPVLKPTYKVKELSAYHYMETVGIGEDEQEDPFHYADSLVQQIIGAPHQELGTHTFGHYYCNEAGQSTEQFRADLNAAQKAAGKYGVVLRSLVFPRNQFNDAYLKVCVDAGIRAVRSNPVDWFWKIDSTQAESKWKRFNRGLDAYFPVGSHNSYRLSDIPVRDQFPVCIPASRLLRPYRPGEAYLNDLKIKRINSEMTRAAQRGEVYHVWWHPHNFGRYPIQSLRALEQILDHYAACRNRYGMESRTMGEVAELREGVGGGR